MIRFCYGTYATVLKMCAMDSRRVQNKLNKALLATVDTCDVKRNEAQASRLFNCGLNLNEINVIEPARKADPKEIADSFNDNILKLIDPNKVKAAILAICSIITSDSTINDDTVVCEICGLTKKDLGNQTKYVAADFLAGVFLYAVCNTMDFHAEKAHLIK